MGLPRSSYYYRRHPRPFDLQARSRQHCRQPAALTRAEREQVIRLLTDPGRAARSVSQVYWDGLDGGLIGCSRSTFYRIARAEGMVGDQRRGRHNQPAARGSRPIPVAAADRVNQLWSWDITQLPGPGKRRYQLLLAIDVYSRYPVGWRIVSSATRQDAVELFTQAFAAHGLPKVLHADNGTQMRSHAMADLLADTVTASYSRPHVSDDNPFSEALFKTIKYDQTMPEYFSDIEHAKDWTEDYLHRYATRHHHAGLNHYTPEQVFTGTVTAAHRARQDRLEAYYQTHPERFRRPPQAPPPPTGTGINLSKAA